MFDVNTPNASENIAYEESIKTEITVGLVSFGLPEILESFLQYS